MTIPLFSQLVESFFLSMALLGERDFIMPAARLVIVIGQNRHVSLPIWNDFENNEGNPTSGVVDSKRNPYYDYSCSHNLRSYFSPRRGLAARRELDLARRFTGRCAGTGKGRFAFHARSVDWADVRGLARR